MNRIDIQEQSVVVHLEDRRLVLPRIPLPADFLRWQCKARLAMFDRLAQRGAEAVQMQPAHLPVLATLGDGPFPINLVSRGLGLVPRPEHLAAYTRRFQDTLAQVQDRLWSDTLPQRVAAVRSLYDRPDHLDPWLLGGLEIFEGQTARNLHSHSLASLLYTGQAPRFPSYQFDGVVVFVGPDDPTYRFLLAARELFAHDAFHIHQVRYPYGYLFHVTAMRDKTPYPRR